MFQSNVESMGGGSITTGHIRASSLGGGNSDIFGSFRFKEDGPSNMTRAASFSAGSSKHNRSSSLYITPKHLGIQELYLDIPFTAVHGMQQHQRKLSHAFAMSAAEFDVAQHPEMSVEEKKSRLSTASMILLEEIQFESNVVTIPLLCATMVAAISQFLVGYNTGVMNAPAHIVFPGHSTLLWSLAVAAFAVGGPFGSIVGGTLADQRGRRGALLLCIWIFLIGGILQTCAYNMWTIIIARFLIGFGSGYSSVLVPIYLGEIAPPTLRGMLGTMTQFALVIGILISNLIAFPTVRRENWRALFSITPMIAMIQLMMASSFLLESPRWLLNRDPNSYIARYIIKQLRGLRYDHEVEQEVDHYFMGCDKQRVDNYERSSQMDVLQEMWRKPKVRKLLISSLILQL
jgi:MFS transporter, SP family, solute carrier family 2 (facilitated glucose transporter), member 3